MFIDQHEHQPQIIHTQVTSSMSIPMEFRNQVERVHIHSNQYTRRRRAIFREFVNPFSKKKEIREE